MGGISGSARDTAGRYQSRVADQAAAYAQAVDHTHLDAIRIDTDGHTAAHAADLTPPRHDGQARTRPCKPG